MPHYSDDELLDKLRECKSKHGKVNHIELNEDDSMPSGPTYNYRFGSLSEALEEAGLHDESKTSRTREGKRTSKYTTTEISEYLNEISENGNISRKMVRRTDGPSHQTICRHANDSTLKGFVESNTSLDFVEEYEREIRDKVTVANELKTTNDDNEYISISLISSVDYYPSMNEIVHHFGSLDNAADELGLDLYTRIKTKRNDAFSEHYVYVLSVKHNGDQKFYVGESSKIFNRITHHISSDQFEVEYVERIISVPKENAKEREREMSLDIARKYKTNDILGGK